jgi:type II secretory pathway component PulF
MLFKRFVQLIKRMRQRGVTATFALEQLADMLTAGVDLASAFTTLASQGRKTERVLGQRGLERLERGLPLAVIFAPYVDPITLTVLSLAEEIGSLPEAMGDYVQRDKARRNWRQQCVKALVYPVLLLFACLALAVFVRFQIQPELRDLQLQIASPQTHGSMITKFATNLPLLVVDGVVVLPLTYIGLRVLRTRFHLSFALPGDMYFRAVHSERLAYLLHVQLAAGLSVVEALESMETAGQGRGVSVHSAYMRIKILAGERFVDALFPGCHPILLQLCLTGEQTGDIAGALERTSTVLRAQLMRQLQQFTAWLEPGAMAMMGVVVAATMYSVFGPMYSTVSDLSNGSSLT